MPHDCYYYQDGINYKKSSYLNKSTSKIPTNFVGRKKEKKFSGTMYSKDSLSADYENPRHKLDPGRYRKALLPEVHFFR